MILLIAYFRLERLNCAVVMHEQLMYIYACQSKQYDNINIHLIYYISILEVILEFFMQLMENDCNV